MRVSILLLTFNEEKNLTACLTALAWCDDIVVLDSGSTDQTVSIAQAFGARILSRSFDTFASQRNWGLENGEFRNEWVLHLDADEITTPEFISALQELSPEDGIDAYNVPSKMMLFGKWIRFAGMYPTYQVRLGHRDRLRFIQVGHGQREDLSAERIAIFSEPYLHYSFSHGLRGWLNKHVRYAQDEAGLIMQLRKREGQGRQIEGVAGRRRAAKANAAQLPVVLRPVLRFLYTYIWRQGFRDGRAGFAYAFMLAVYEGMTAIFVLESILASNSMPEQSEAKDTAT